MPKISQGYSISDAKPWSLPGDKNCCPSTVATQSPPVISIGRWFGATSTREGMNLDRQRLYQSRRQDYPSPNTDGLLRCLYIFDGVRNVLLDSEVFRVMHAVVLVVKVKVITLIDYA